MLRSIINNLSVFFSVIGILMTLYLSIFYLPGHIKGKQAAKIERMNRNLVGSIRELVFRDQPIGLNTIESLINGQELRENLSYPYPIDQLLVQTQESMVGNEFIPLAKRQYLIDKLDTIRSRLVNAGYGDRLSKHPDDEEVDWFKKAYWDKTNISIAISGIFGVIVSFLGLYSLYYKLKIEKDAEIRHIIDSKKDTLEEAIRISLLFDGMVREVVSELDLDHQVFVHKLGKADILIKTPSGNPAYIKVRYFRDPQDMPADFIKNLIRMAEANKTSGILITNLEPGEHLNGVDQYNKTNEVRKIYLIVAETGNEIKAMLMNTLNRIDGKE